MTTTAQHTKIRLNIPPAIFDTLVSLRAAANRAVPDDKEVTSSGILNAALVVAVRAGLTDELIEDAITHARDIYH